MECAFSTLKAKLTTNPVLHLLDFLLSFFVETDVSGSTMGAVLVQHGNPIDYFRKNLCPTLLHGSTYAKELCAMGEAIKKWCHYLLGR